MTAPIIETLLADAREKRQPMTPRRAFELAELVALRGAHYNSTPHEIADAIRRLASAWNMESQK